MIKRHVIEVSNLHHLGNEERQANADGGNESTPVFLASQHEYSDKELSSKEDLNEEALGNTRAAAQRGRDPQGAGGESINDSRGNNATEDLSGDDQQEADPVGGADDDHGDGDGRIQHGPADAEENPRIDGETKPEAQTDVEETRGGVAIRERVGHVGAAEREQQEQEGSHELACRGDEVCWLDMLILCSHIVGVIPSRRKLVPLRGIIIIGEEGCGDGACETYYKGDSVSSVVQRQVALACMQGDGEFKIGGLGVPDRGRGE